MKEAQPMIPELKQICLTPRPGGIGAGALLLAALAFGGVNAASAQETRIAQAAQGTQTAEIGAVAKRYPPGSISSVEIADRALAEVGRERNAVQARYAREEQNCNPKFFSSSCMEAADDSRRQALRQLRAVEVEANTVKRQAKATARDEELAVKREKEGASREERDAARNVPMPNSGAQDAAPQPTDKPLPSGRPRSGDRVAEHEEKMRAIREKEASEADKRAKNVANYERKVKEAEARQQDVAKRKEEKARKLEEKRQRAEAAQKPL
jgi:hypothetical protein